MASITLPVECLTIIFEQLSYEKLGVKNYSFTLLHSCILVNKIWCATAIPILWRNPWNWLIEGLYLNRLTLLTATFISCLPKEIKNILTRNQIIKMKKWMKNVTSFDYPYFMNGLDYSWLYFSINIFLKENFKKGKEFIRNEYSIILLKEICKLFMKRSYNLIQLNYDNQYQKRYDYYKIRVEDYINLIHLPGANQTLIKLKRISITGWIPSEIIYGISKICKNIEEIKINNFQIEDDEEGIITLIKEQKSLKRFSFEIKLNDELEDKFGLIEFSISRFEKVIKSKLQKLVTLKLSPICFYMDNFMECYNLEELILIDERQQFNEKILEKFSKNSKLFKLKKLEININYITFKQISSIIKNTNYNLEIITIIWMEGIDEIEDYKNFIETIIFYCPKLKEYNGKFDYNYISLLCKNCNNLTKLGFNDFNILDISDILKQIGDVIPVNLSKLSLPLCWNFNSDSLEYFLEKCLIRLHEPLYFNIYESEKHAKIIKRFRELKVLARRDYY
ncbi:hypothetical protein RclHR1_03740004 [Rhizophagus clarus]|uniref:F-box domain-containing protein n=1 Tax=Rhizophagus clarus TaxID=94130 RepID=A0A2Z6RSW1_9GLOM|nr:hypothetical protein RclHR1_03740004 [Rhizophagus clarus]GES82850.1 hypothetical protein GLOIN_2v515811 [Rhizophagus clarus]